MLWLIIGGSEQGKLALASRQYKEQTGLSPEVFDAGLMSQNINDRSALEELLIKSLDYETIDHIHLLLRPLSLVCEQTEFDSSMTLWLEALHNKHSGHPGKSQVQIIVLDDIGCGVVPLQPEDRVWRERCGRLYCRLTAQAEKVQRVWAGIPQTLKEECR